MTDYAQSKVLVVDDVPSARQVVMRLMKQIGFRLLEEAETGSLALDRLQKGGIDLVIADAEMPGMTGYDLLKQLRKEPEYQSLPFILTATSASKSDVIDAFNSGVTKFLVKPFNLKTLKKTLSQIEDF